MFVMTALSGTAHGQTALLRVASAEIASGPTESTGSGVITLGTESYQVVNASDLPLSTAATATESGDIVQVGC